MGNAKAVVTGLIVTLVAFIVAVPVLTSMFARGGAFDGLQGVLEGSCEYTGSVASTGYSTIPSNVYFGTPAGGLTVPQGATPSYGLHSALIGTAQNPGDLYGLTVTGAPYLAYFSVGENHYIVAHHASAAFGFPACDPDIAAVPANPTAVTASTGAFTSVVNQQGRPTALADSTYQPILVAIFGLIPLGLMIAVGWYFVGQRIMGGGMGGGGGGRRRRSRRR